MTRASQIVARQAVWGWRRTPPRRAAAALAWLRAKAGAAALTVCCVLALLSVAYATASALFGRRGGLAGVATDGVTEALNEAGEEFGEERLIRALEEAAPRSTAEELRAEVVRRVGLWCGSAPQHDDLTVVVLKVK